jgi:putative aldouronate transport system permease protein
MKLTKGDMAYQIVVYCVVSALLLAAVFPLFYVVSASFVSENEWMRSDGRVIIPRQPVLNNYRMVINESPTILNAIRISIIRTLLGTSLTIFFSMSLGYVLSRNKIPFKKILLFMTLVTILFGSGLIPAFLVVNGTKLYNTIWAMIIPGLVDSWAVLIFRQFFLNTPPSIEESARIDGAGEIAIMWVIVVPLSKAVIAALTLFSAVGHWNAWFDAVVFIKEASLKPFQLLMRDLFVSTSTLTLNMGTSTVDLNRRITPNGIRMAITVIGTIPILLIYPFLQKYFSKGVYMGAVKE